ncbi:hypothetical protein RJ639_022376 [Escallonia herrerae]|uniref:UBC core domain-containing protein n=1 Tax=Escallonia herrerae TaxID=1293975 RepID=A0AA88V8E4_9ASTE|nr:hypothetical protein RJ639_022376 [Escallonia herrerae]
MAAGEIQQEAAPFRRFDVADDDSDHRYHANAAASGKSGHDCFVNPSTGVHKKIMKEWQILRDHLPDTIYVRVYEQRIDLLRTAIVGPPGTPYENGLYFFDLAFPPDYPARPPLVHYRSFGFRLNPNLYETGYVCLSLLNTWVGKKSEKWNPAESTVLQVLVSIQGLVLNERPYFNEPGIGIFPAGAKRSVAYSEDAFVLSCRSMLCLLRTPPKNFKELVRKHFRDRAGEVLTLCNAYMDGCGQQFGGGVKFRAAMEPVFDELVAAFARNGASVGYFVEQVRERKEAAARKAVEVEEVKKSKKVKKKTKFEVVKKVIEKIKMVLGLEKDGKPGNQESRKASREVL